ncbi:MAG: SDR family NAD(P)-dependent oxidoreductase [Christensenellales bacterium]|jgi:NAD(P)-dependent dehydrogenase (short-subunit alcohol dehydrogenase family)
MSGDMFSLKGRAAIITGASRGLGRYMAKALAQAGADVAVTSRTTDSLKGTCSEIEAMGVKALPIELDVRSHDSIKNAISAAVGEFGKLDIAVCNAGMNIRKHAADIEWDEYNAIMDTNLRGAFFTAQEAARQSMLKNRYGRIITIGSANCLRPMSFCSVYAASRMGVVQMTKAMAGDWGSYGITVNCIGPGWFPTEQTKTAVDDPKWRDGVLAQTPAGRFGGEHDLDGTVVFLASNAAPYLTGQLIMVDGGFSLGDLETPSNVPCSKYM